MAIAYLAPEGFADELKVEVGENSQQYGRLLLCEQPPPITPVWVQNIWYNPVKIEANSISAAVHQLRALQLRWVNYSYHLYRRSQLIQEQLPKIKTPLLKFLDPVPAKSLGSWTLLDENFILASPLCSSPFPNGEVYFQENKKDPPSRAYLKLWELFTVYGVKPKAGEICLDLGSSPGGWTWVLTQLGCKVISVDKALLDRKLVCLPLVRYLPSSAFAVSPKEIGPINWLFSDVICYPERLLKLILKWLESGLCENYICTLKFQGKTDHEIIKNFAAIPNSRIIHLHNNKHELTWIKTKLSP